MLRTFFREPAKIFYVRELTRALETQINAVRRELALLLEAGIVVETDVQQQTGVEANTRKKYYKLNTASLLYPELQSLLIKDVMMSEQEFLQELEQKGGDIQLILVCGMFMGVQDAPSDLFIVGQIKERAMTKLISDYERELGSPIRYTFMTEQEFADRRHIMDRFVFSMFETKHVKAVNKLGL